MALRAPAGCSSSLSWVRPKAKLKHSRFICARYKASHTRVFEPLYLAQMKRKCFSFALGRTQDKEEEQPAGALSAIEPEIGRSDSSSTLVRQKSDGI